MFSGTVIFHIYFSQWHARAGPKNLFDTQDVIFDTENTHSKQISLGLLFLGHRLAPTCTGFMFHGTRQSTALNKTAAVPVNTIWPRISFITTELSAVSPHGLDTKLKLSCIALCSQVPAQNIRTLAFFTSIQSQSPPPHHHFIIIQCLKQVGFFKMPYYLQTC